MSRTYTNLQATLFCNLFGYKDLLSKIFDIVSDLKLELDLKFKDAVNISFMSFYFMLMIHMQIFARCRFHLESRKEQSASRLV